MRTKSLPMLALLSGLVLVFFITAPVLGQSIDPDPLITNVLMEAAGLLGLDISPDCTQGMCTWLDPVNNTLTYQHPSGSFDVFMTGYWLSDFDLPLAWVTDTIGMYYTEYDLDYGSRAYFLEQTDDSLLTIPY